MVRKLNSEEFITFLCAVTHAMELEDTVEKNDRVVLYDTIIELLKEEYPDMYKEICSMPVFFENKEPIRLLKYITTTEAERFLNLSPRFRVGSGMVRKLNAGELHLLVSTVKKMLADESPLDVYGNYMVVLKHMRPDMYAEILSMSIFSEYKSLKRLLKYICDAEAQKFLNP